jgi:hypothetical protein
MLMYHFDLLLLYCLSFELIKIAWIKYFLVDTVKPLSGEHRRALEKCSPLRDVDL